MSHRRLWVAATIIAIVLIVGFALSVPHTGEVVHTPATVESTDIPSVTLHDVFKKGTHTIIGSLPVPNACTSVTATAVAVGGASSTEGIRIDVSMTRDTGTCLQLPTSLSFSTTVIAPAHVPLSATVNGIEATTTVL